MQVLDQYFPPLDVHLYMTLALAPILFANSVRSLKYLVPFSLISNAVMYTGGHVYDSTSPLCFSLCFR